jgi:outer membrane protein TolC
MTLRQALDVALAQNPDIVLARLDQQRAAEQVLITRDPFSPKMGVGGGYAATYGFPASIDGNAPSIFQARGQMAIFDRPLTYRVRQAEESVRASDLDIALRREDTAYQVYTLFLDAEQAAQSVAAIELQMRSLERVEQLTGVLVAEGRQRAIEQRQAGSDVRRAGLALADFRRAQTDAELALGAALGLPPGDQVRPAQEERGAIAVATAEEEAIAQALGDSRELRRLESNITAKQLEIKSYQAERLPKMNLFGQYQLLSRFNNFDTFYPRFQRHNAQIGVSVEIPVLIGPAAGASISQAEIDIQKLETEAARTRRRISDDVRRAYADVTRAEAQRDAASADLDLARERVSLNLIEYNAGRLLMAELEASRAAEQEQWILYYDAQRALETARLNVLRGTGTLLAALQ